MFTVLLLYHPTEIKIDNTLLQPNQTNTTIKLSLYTEIFVGGCFGRNTGMEGIVLVVLAEQ